MSITTATLPLFSAEEALSRVGSARGSGCLLLFNLEASVHLFIENGAVVSAKWNDVSGEQALQHGLQLSNASYRWIPDAEPSNRSVSINIEDYMASHLPREDRAGKTIKMAVYERVAKKPEFQYYFIPEESPTARLRVNKSPTVVGREPACDLVIKSFQVSRRHCLLQTTERGLLIKDLDSTNGTFINGIALGDGYVTDGDRIGLGTYAMTLRREKVH